MPTIYDTGSQKFLQRAMCFIDGGYLRNGTKRLYGHDFFEYENLLGAMVNNVSQSESGMKAYVIRTFYYDARPEDQNDPKYSELSEYLKKIKKSKFFEVKLGTLVKSGNRYGNEDGYRQKGVDVLIAIDMLTKAYENHFDWAIVLAGDADFVNLVKAVKDTGKRVYGFYFTDNTSDRLKEGLDVGYELDRLTTYTEILQKQP